MDPEPFDLDAVLAAQGQDQGDVFDLDAELARRARKKPQEPKKTAAAAPPAVPTLPVSPAAFPGLVGSKIEAEPSLWEKTKGFAKGLGTKTAELAYQAASMPEDITSGLVSLAADRLGPDAQTADLKRTLDRARAKRAIESKVGLGEHERALPGERGGRAVAAMLPQIGIGSLTAGASIPAQAAVAGMTQGAQSLAEGASPQEAALAGGASAVFGGLGGGVSRALAPGKAALSPEVIASAKRLGVELPASVQTTSDAVRYLEGWASKVPGGGQIGQRAQAARDVLSGMASDVTTAAEQNAIRTGETAAAGYKRSKEIFDLQRRALYREAKVKGIPVTPETTLQEIDGMLTEGTMKPSDLAFLRKLRAQIAPQPSKALPTLKNGEPLPPEMAAQFGGGETVPRDATRIWSLQRGLSEAGWTNPNAVPMGSPALRRRLAGTLKGDLQKAVGEAQPDTLAAMNRADAFFAENAPKVNSQAANSVLRLARQGQHDKIAGRLFSPSMSIQEIPRILEAAGPESTAGIQESVMAQLMKSGTNKAGELTPQGLKGAVKKWGPAKIQKILSPEQYQTVQDMATVSEAFAGMNRIARGSSTGGLQQWTLPLATGMYGTYQAGKTGDLSNLLIPMGATAAQSAFARLIGSELGRQWLTRGLPGAAGIGAGVGLAGRAPLAGFVSDQRDYAADLANARRRRELQNAGGR